MKVAQGNSPDHADLEMNLKEINETNFQIHMVVMYLLFTHII